MQKLEVVCCRLLAGGGGRDLEAGGRSGEARSRIVDLVVYGWLRALEVASWKLEDGLV